MNIDVLENDFVNKYPGVLEILLYDHTTKKNIIWASDNYEKNGDKYLFDSSIEVCSITGKNGLIIRPRIKKNLSLQTKRKKNMAEVFTPSWICNIQNNLIDSNWFKRKNVFNKTLTDRKSWKTIKKRIIFPKNKKWIDYILDKRLEISCGEAPYITSRYDTTTGKFINISERIGIIDRKLRIINENVNELKEWKLVAQQACKSTYAYEWQGDSLLLARQSILITFIEYYYEKFKSEPNITFIKKLAEIISWNIWQMDGINFIVPNSCRDKVSNNIDLFGEVNKKKFKCQGCLENDPFKHNGEYCIIRNWDEEKISLFKTVRFIDIIKKRK